MNLPTPLAIDASGRRSSARARRPAAKLRDADEVDDNAPSSGTRGGELMHLKEKVAGSPRRKRGSGPGGSAAGGKRKRKEVDDGDATYPAKRTTRLPRGTANGRSATDEPSEDVSTPVPIGEMVDLEEEKEKEKKPERRSTRSRSGLKRRDSSASEATSVSVVGGGGKRSAEDMDVEEKEESEGKQEKQEEGDVSEGAGMPP
jgi:hypothetical protein